MAEVRVQHRILKDKISVSFTGDYLRYDHAADTAQVWGWLQEKPYREIVLNGAAIRQWDSTLLVLFYEIAKMARNRHIRLVWEDMPQGIDGLLKLAFSVERNPQMPSDTRPPFLERVGLWGVTLAHDIGKGLGFIGSVLRSFRRFFSFSAVMRRVDFFFALEECGYKAVPIVCLISFMVGLILAFVGAVQLKIFGAQIYVASLVAVAMTRIMGAIMIGVIMAGRTGASYAATIGTMQVNEEIDALKTMGVPVTDFLVLPRVAALMITMPFLTVLADFAGMLGGAAVGVFMLDIAPQEYWRFSLEALSLTNFWVGVFHGFVFGAVIALCGCYYGVFCGRSADSVGVATTRAVVSAIVWMIVMTGIITFFCEVLGI